MSDASARWPEVRLLPSGALRSRGEAEGEGPKALSEALEAGAGRGLLRLVTAELATPLPEPWAFWRELARGWMTKLCARPDLEETKEIGELALGAVEASELLRQAPPFEGAEYLDEAALGRAWGELGAAVAAEVEGFASAAAWLEARAPLWSRVGRVSFHLAENKRDPSSPFAFLATFAHRVSDHGSVQHLPLLRALELYGAGGDRQRLLRMLAPLERAAKASPFIERLVESNAVYRPLAFSAGEAYELLRAAPAIEAAGVQVRLPDWWRSKPRPVVSVQVGGKASGIGAEGLLDFSASVALGDQRLTEQEVQRLLEADQGLVQIRGQWVEVDRARLEQALSHWKKVEKLAKSGLSFAEAMRLLLGFEREGLGEPEPTVASWSRVEAGPWLAERLRELREPERRDEEARALAGLRATLRPYQQVGVRWLHLLGRLGLGACLADDMGLGKTIQVIGAMLLRTRQGPGEAHLVVAPASLLGNWSAELARFAPSLRVRVAHGSAGKGQEAQAAAGDVDVVLTTYGMLARQPWLRERRWGLVVLDEAQAIKNPGAKQSKLARSLDGAARVAVTGTPVENRLGDLWSIFDFLNPGLLGSARSFSSFIKESQRRQGSLGRLRGLVRPYLLRRLKSDRNVAADLPPKTEMAAYCLLTPRQVALYQAEVDALRGELRRRDAMARRGAVLAAMLRLKQICDHPSLATGDGAFAPEDSGKLRRLAELCDEIAQRQERVLVFTQFREMTAPLVAFLAKLFGAPGLCLHGGTPVPERRRLVEAFQRDDGPPFFVISLKAGGVGLNLTAASHVIHYDRWWNPAVEDQATDRAHRIGQHRLVLVHKMLCKGTLDERIDEMIQKKRTLAAEVVEEASADQMLTELPDDELLRLVSLDLKAVSDDS